MTFCWPHLANVLNPASALVVEAIDNLIFESSPTEGTRGRTGGLGLGCPHANHFSRTR